MDIFKNFGVEPTLLLAQIVNFLIILFLLKKFFYGKITKALDERKERIEESLKNADLIETKLTETEEKSKKILDEALNEAQKITKNAQDEAQKIYEETQKETKERSEELILQAKSEIARERDNMKNELEKDTIILVSGVVKKVLGRNLSVKEKESLNTKSLSEIASKL